MKMRNPPLHHRRSIRLTGYDYSQAGAYFLTVCAYRRGCLFGEIVDGQTRLNANGEIVNDCWHRLPEHYPNIKLDAFVVMPNHIHAIVVLTPGVGAGFKPAPTPQRGPPPAPTPQHGLPEIVRGFKTFSSRRINEGRRTSGVPVWQHNYYDHIIRDEGALERIRQYIVLNPARWAQDEENPGNNPRGLPRPDI